MSLLAQLFSHSTIGVFAVDLKERIVFWNAACERLFGTFAQEAIGHACHDVVHACDLSGQPFCNPGCHMARLAGGGSATQPFPLRFDNGRGKAQKLWVRTMLAPSQQSDLWAVVHLLCPEENADLLQQPGLPQGDFVEKRTLHPVPADPLTIRERGILQLLAQGHTSSVISKQLCISIVTVRNHMQHLNEKLGVHSQLEAVAYAHRNNFL